MEKLLKKCYQHPLGALPELLPMLVDPARPVAEIPRELALALQSAVAAV